MADDIRPTRNLPAALLARRPADGYGRPVPVRGTPPPTSVEPSAAPASPPGRARGSGSGSGSATGRRATGDPAARRSGPRSARSSAGPSAAAGAGAVAASRGSVVAVADVTTVGAARPQPSRTRVAVSLPGELANRAEAQALEENRGLSTWIRMHLATGLDAAAASVTPAGRTYRRRSRSRTSQVQAQLYLDAEELVALDAAVAASGATRSTLVVAVIADALG